jgi:hypothetical protein
METKASDMMHAKLITSPISRRIVKMKNKKGIKGYEDALDK